MVVLPHMDDFKSLSVWITIFLVLIVDSMALQNPDDWKLSLSQLLDDLIQCSQPSTFRRHVQDEVETFKR
jgi:hypothetical protein